jgi:hypothetical protein
LPWWQQRVYEDYLVAQNEAQQQAAQQSGYAPDPPSGDTSGMLDPFAPALVMQQAGFNVEIAQPSNDRE